MNLNIFFSWQSERPEASEFVTNTLTECCKELSKELGAELTVLQPSDENRGAYNINNAIDRAIHSSDIVVADLTPTSTGPDGRRNPNSNVIFEFATAREFLKSENVLATADIAGEDLSKMPFDFNHNSLISFDSVADPQFKERFKKAIGKIVKAKLLPTIHDATTVFFSRRIAQSFPGVRGIQWYDDPSDIRMHLNAFFRHPIHFGESTDMEGDTVPIWWFRGAQAEEINSYSVLPNGIYLLGWNELKINRIAVLSDTARYFSEYIYVEASPMVPFNKEHYTPERISELKRDFDYIDEEYAVVREGSISIEVSRQEFDDGHAMIGGEIVPIHGKASLRCRYLTPFNFIIAAKYSPYNSHEFCRSSNDYFNGLLDGSVVFEDFARYLRSLPKYSRY